MRTTGFEEHREPIVVGEPEVGQTLARALDSRGDVERGTHGFHAYPAGLHPDAARILVEAFPGVGSRPVLRRRNRMCRRSNRRPTDRGKRRFSDRTDRGPHARHHRT